MELRNVFQMKIKNIGKLVILFTVKLENKEKYFLIDTRTSQDSMR